MDDDAQHSAARTQPAARTEEAVAWTVLARLISGPLLYGGLGWFVDSRLGTEPVFVLVGILGGMTLALYLVWVRYGSHDRRPPAASPDAGHHRT